MVQKIEDTYDPFKDTKAPTQYSGHGGKLKELTKEQLSLSFIKDKLSHIGYSANDVRSLWTRSARNDEALGIISDLTGLYRSQLRVVLGLERSDVSMDNSQSCLVGWLGE